VQQQTQQAGLTALYNQFLQQQSYPFQTAQFLANVAEGTGALSGQTTSTTQPAPFFSDRRLKENVKRIGTAKNGLPIHSFNYKEDPDKLTRLGFMADEVEKKHPEAVGLAGGYKTVDYDRAARASGGGTVTDFDEGQGYDDGGLVNPSNPWGQLISKESQIEGGAGVGAAPGLDPYTSANRHVPKLQAPSNLHLLQPSQMPQQQKSGLQQAGGLLQQGIGSYKDIKGMYSDAQGMYGDAKKALGSNDPKPAAPAAKTAAPADNSPVGKGPSDAAVAKPTAALDTPVTGGLAPTNVAELVPADAAAAATSAVNPLTGLAGSLFGNRGGSMRAHREVGGGFGPAAGVPDVVAPTAAYMQGLGEAQDAQHRANQLQDESRAKMAASGITTSPDLTPLGQTMNNQGVFNSMKSYGGPEAYIAALQNTPATWNGPYAHGGLAEGFADGGDTGGLDIPDDKSWQQDRAEQSSMAPKGGGGEGGGGSGAMGAIGSAIGLATKVLPLFALAGGGLVPYLPRRRSKGGHVLGADGSDGFAEGGTPYGALDEHAFDKSEAGAVEREDDDDLPPQEREGASLPRDNIPLPPERPAGLGGGHDMPGAFDHLDVNRPTVEGRHTSMAPDNFTPKGLDPAGDVADPRAELVKEPRAPWGIGKSSMAPDNFTPDAPAPAPGLGSPFEHLHPTARNGVAGLGAHDMGPTDFTREAGPIFGALGNGVTGGSYPGSDFDAELRKHAGLAPPAAAAPDAPSAAPSTIQPKPVQVSKVAAPPAAPIAGDRARPVTAAAPSTNFVQDAGNAGFTQSLDNARRNISDFASAGANNVHYAAAYLQSKGWSPMAVAGIVGQFLNESGQGLDPRAVGAGGDFGLAQWLGDRKRDLQQFAQSNGWDYRRLDTQLAFVDHELRTKEAATGKALQAARNPYEAAVAGIGYERPKNWNPKNPTAGKNWAGRYNSVQQLANNLNKKGQS
jgi:hypothetical protein